MSYNSAYVSSPDHQSNIYPDRLIRPLPKRSLKSRLSQEAAETIEFPPSLPSSSLPSYSQHSENGEYANESKVLVQNGEVYDSHEHDHEHEHEHNHDHDDPHYQNQAHDHYHDHDHDHCHHHHHCNHEDEEDVDSAEDSSPVALRHANAYKGSPNASRSTRHPRYGNSVSKNTSGPDGYEAFENTNNKKKRKIPTSGSLSLHQSSLTQDLAHLGLSGDKDGAADDLYAGQSTSSGSSGLGVQGAGRGHYARKGNGRRPLGVSVNGSNIKSGASKYDQTSATSGKGEDSKDQGIISAAIANATALLRKPLGKEQENTGVLDQQVKQNAANSQFTFTCETDAKGVTFPEQSLYSPGYSQRNVNLPPPTPGASGSKATQASQAAPMPQSSAQQASGQNAANTQPRKPRRRRGDVYTLAARQRKLQQEYSNIQHPPAGEDIWICEFCEYESIFGQPPHALIRQYEIKDRKERRRLAEKRRLLEKAKLKGRKGKKQTKAAKASNNTSLPAGSQQAYDQQPLDQLGDDDLDYGYDDDPIPVSEPPPAPLKQPIPGTYDTVGKGGGGGTAGAGGGGGGGGR